MNRSWAVLIVLLAVNLPSAWAQIYLGAPVPTGPTADWGISEPAGPVIEFMPNRGRFATPPVRTAAYQSPPPAAPASSWTLLDSPLMTREQLLAAPEVRQTFWFKADYLMWWTKSAPVVGPLVTGGSFDGTTVTFTESQILFGNQNIDYGPFSGLQLEAGISIDCDLAFVASGFRLERQTNRDTFASDANGSPVLSRPLFITDTGGQERAFLISAPGVATGRLDVTSSSRFWGAEGNLVRKIRNDRIGFNVLAGYRHLNLQEDLGFIQQLNIDGTQVGSFGPNTFPGPAQYSINDSFNTCNEFHGAQIGFQAEVRGNGMTLGLGAKLAMGVVHETVTIAGNTQLLSNSLGQTGNLPGGLLNQPSNIGSRSSDRFAVVPEFNANVAYQLAPRVWGHFGYTFLYISDVVRPGQQIDTTLNPIQAPITQVIGTSANPNRPTAIFDHTDYWAQGINLGLEFRF